MYIALTIDNYRVFKHLELKRLQRVNLFGGMNNAGKSSLLEAVALVSGNIDVISFRSQRQDIHLASEEILDLFNFTNDRDNILISGYWIDNLRSFHIFPVTLQDVPTEKWRYLLEQETVPAQFYEFRISSPKNYVMAYLWHHRLMKLSYFENMAIFLHARYKSGDGELNSWFSKLIREEKEEILLNTLQIFEPKLERINLLDDGFYLKIPPRKPTSIRNMGEGFQRSMEMILAVANAKDGVLIVDEIENGLHHSVQTQVWRAIAEAAEKFNVQVFASTHSLEMICSAHEAFLQMPTYDFAYYRLYKDANGDISASRYDDESMDGAFYFNAEVRG